MGWTTTAKNKLILGPDSFCFQPPPMELKTMLNKKCIMIKIITNVEMLFLYQRWLSIILCISSIVLESKIYHDYKL